jgi:hypothetical protein
MKGDFSFVDFDVASNYTSVRHQQGRVLLDRDWNDAQAIDGYWRRTMAGDAFGLGVLAVPSSQPDSFRVLSAVNDPAGIHVELDAGRAWASGVPVQLGARSVFSAEYVAPAGSAPATRATIVAGTTRDLVLLEVFEDTVSGFQDPATLIEPALGGPDTTERVKAFWTVKLLRLDVDEDCSAAASLVDDPAAQGGLTVSPAPSAVITGDCPLELGGGYTGLEHYLYRIEIAEPRAGRARFKWSQFNGGLAGRGVYVAATNTVTITANDQAINTCGVPKFYLEALDFDSALGAWTVRMTADATPGPTEGMLTLANVQGTWPAANAFFRLWNGIRDIQDFAIGGPVDFFDGLRLQFDPPAAGNANYRPGDYWAFPVRAGGADFASALWPTNAPPAGVVYRRVALGILHWQDRVADWDRGEIDDCRRIFRPLTNQKVCCSFLVGDGRTSFGDFNSIELALRHLPSAGGEICLLPGTHATNALISGRQSVTIRGCGARTTVMPRAAAMTAPIFSVVDSTRIEIEHMDLVALDGIAIDLAGTRPGACDDISITRHRILAYANAVRAREVSGLTIAHNRIRMLDKAGGLAAIDIASDDALVERNDIRVVPAPQTPPVDPTDPEPIDPVDPCAPLDLVYTRPVRFRGFVDRFWAVPISLVSLIGLAAPYRALGGIHVRNGSERVRILENRIVGGAGNGITLGALTVSIAPPAQQPFEFDLVKSTIIGRVVGPDGNPRPGVPIVFTRTSTGEQKTLVSAGADASFTFGPDAGRYAVSDGDTNLEIAQCTLTDRGDLRFLLMIRMKAAEQPLPPQSGFLYDIAIERNDIAAMGLNGIATLDPANAAPAGAGAAILAVGARRDSRVTFASRLLGSPVIGLAIRDNRISHNLRNPFTPELREIAATRGLGGISLGLVDDLAITGNRIEANGTSGVNPACGVFVHYGETIEIARNVILDNGLVLRGMERAPQSGIRGGVVLQLAASFGLFASLRGKAGNSGAKASALRVLANHVEQPVGCALQAHVFGPAMIDDNVLASDRGGGGRFDGMVSTVMLVNLSGVQETGPAVRLKASISAATAAGAPTAKTQPIGALAAMRIPTNVVALVPPLLPLGSILFNDNQTRSGAEHTEPITQVLMGYDDVSFEGNQSYVDQPGVVLANTMIFGGSVRAIGNRLRERSTTTTLSLLTVAERANVTSLNQTDHCIIARTTSATAPATVNSGNQMLSPSPLCMRLGTVASLLFMPQE